MKPKTPRPVIIAPVVGATLVWYNFHLFGMLATTISPRFFTKATPTITTIAYFSTFAAGLILRPLGAFIFGRVGDLGGSKRALSQTLLLTGLATTVMGMLPTYPNIGVTAPVVLLALRMLQGLAFGGVYAGALLSVAEHAPKEKRGFYTSWVQMTPILGLLLSLAAVFFVRQASGSANFAAYGWRLTFLPSVILIALWLYMRRKKKALTRAPHQQEDGEREATTERSLLGGLRASGNLKLILTSLFLAAGQAALWYVTQFYAMFHLQNVLKVEAFKATCIVVVALLLGLPFFVLCGALSDKFGRKKLMLAGCLLAAVLYVPIYMGMQRAAGTHVLTIKPVRNAVTGADGPTPLTLAGGVLKPAAESPHPNLFALTALVLLQVVLLAMVSGPLGAYFAEAFPYRARYTSTALSHSIAHGVVGSLLPVFSLPLLVSSGNIYAGLYYAIAVALISFLIGVFTIRETVLSGSNGSDAGGVAFEKNS